MEATVYDTSSLKKMLRDRGVNPTSQRLVVARLLFERCEHLSAEQVYLLVNEVESDSRVSKATVYNTLGLFARKGLIREVYADPNRVFYDPNTEPHYHIYNVTDGTLKDFDADSMQADILPALPEDTRLEGVDVIVRVSSD